MATIACPNCGFLQPPAEKCLKCSTLFAYHQAAARSIPAVASQPEFAPQKSAPGVFRRVYRIARWATLAVLLLVVVLILRQSPPPQVQADPQAPARLESKLTRLEWATRAGQPHELRLDESELNSYLGTNLALKREAPLAAAPVAAPPTAEPSIEEMQSSVRDVKIALLGDRVQAYVLFDFHGKDLSLLLEGRLRVEEGYVRFQPTSGKLGSLPLPQTTLDRAVERLFSSPENREKFRVPAEIGDIRVENGELVVAYR